MTVVFVVYPGIVLLDLVGPLQVFTHAKHARTDVPAYVTHVVSLDGGPIATNTIVQIDSAPLAKLLTTLDGPELDTLVIVGGNGAVVSTEMAAAELLDGRRAVTHWEDCELLATRFPKVRVEVDPIFINDGPFWTSAGITAGIDMALAIVQEDLGREPALQLARSLVTPMIRSAGQSQYSTDLARQTQDAAGAFSDLHDWLRGNLSRPISVEDMASQCAMSSRSFSRRYLASVGVSPARSLEQMRVDAAKELLLEPGRSIKTVATECGFRDDETLRRAFHRHLHTSPSGYQAMFGNS